MKMEMEMEMETETQMSVDEFHLNKILIGNQQRHPLTTQIHTQTYLDLYRINISDNL